MASMRTMIPLQVRTHVRRMSNDIRFSRENVSFKPGQPSYTRFAMPPTRTVSSLSTHVWPPRRSSSLPGPLGYRRVARMSNCCGTGGASQDKINPSSSSDVHDSVKDYYGKQLQGSDDLKTSACTTDAMAMPRYIRQAIGEVHDEVAGRYYGCGLVVPEMLEGTSVLDLGSGAGRDCFIVSKLVGETGQVIGVDMTEEQLEVARKYIEYHREKFGFSKANVAFRQGYLEKLDEAGLEDGTFDVIISNCVINLVPDKEAVLKESYRVLRDGGELYFSDVYASEQVSDELRRDAVLWGECLSGALYWEELVSLAKKVGFSAPRLVRAAPISMKSDDLNAKLGSLRFVSATYRLVKVPESAVVASKEECATYDGSAANSPAELEFDHCISFPAEKAVAVSADVSAILHSSRFSKFMKFSARPCCKKVQESDDLNPFTLADSSPSQPGGGCCPAPADSAGASEGCPPVKRPCC